MQDKEGESIEMVGGIRFDKGVLEVCRLRSNSFLGIDKMLFYL